MVVDGPWTLPPLSLPLPNSWRAHSLRPRSTNANVSSPPKLPKNFSQLFVPLVCSLKTAPPRVALPTPAVTVWTHYSRTPPMIPWWFLLHAWSDCSCLTILAHLSVSLGALGFKSKHPESQSSDQPNHCLSKSFSLMLRFWSSSPNAVESNIVTWPALVLSWDAGPPGAPTLIPLLLSSSSVRAKAKVFKPPLSSTVPPSR